MEDANITISRISSNKESDYINVEILISNQIMILKLNLEDYALLLTGRARVNAKGVIINKGVSK